MPLLEAARLRLCEDECDDILVCGNDTSSMDCNGDSCEGCNGNGEGCSVLLEGLSGATHLDFTSHPRVVISLSLSCFNQALPPVLLYTVHINSHRSQLQGLGDLLIFYHIVHFLLRVHLHVDVRYS
jgi:hypothetical protein